MAKFMRSWTAAAWLRRIGGRPGAKLVETASGWTITTEDGQTVLGEGPSVQSAWNNACRNAGWNG